MVKPTDTELKIPGGLTGVFVHCDTCLSDEEFNRLRQHELSEKETHIQLGQFSGSVSGILERGSTASNSQAGHGNKQKNEDRRTAQFVDMVEQIRASIEQMEADIRALEDLFEKRDGDAWREKLALNILDADDIPQQEPGEDINAYRKRLEQHLINEMLNADGSIKGKYKNHAELGDYAEWAQKQYNLNNAQAIAAELDDGNTSPQRQEQILDQMKERRNAEEMMLTDRESKNMDTKSSVRDTRDNHRDEILSQVQSSDTALKFTS